jgi:hypothetical protein
MCVSLSLVGIDQLIMRDYRRDNHCWLKYRPPAPFVRIFGTICLPLTFSRWHCYTIIIRQSTTSPQVCYRSRICIEEELSHWSIPIPGVRKSLVSPHIRHQPQEEIMAAIWELHKDRLYTLYITRNESLRKIMVHMEDDHGFARKYVPILWIES